MNPPTADRETGNPLVVDAALSLIPLAGRCGTEQLFLYKNRSV